MSGPVRRESIGAQCERTQRTILASPAFCRVARGEIRWMRRGFALARQESAALHCMMDFENHITITPGVRSGKPCIKGTRITVYDVLEYLAGGMTEADLIADFPELSPQDIRAALAFAAARERRLASLSAA